MSWINQAKLERKAEREARLAEAAAKQERRSAIEAAQVAEGLKEQTIEQATTYITNQIGAATNLEELKTRVTRVLTRMVPYILQ